MAKLYWRVKKNGKWTWRPAKDRACYCIVCGRNGTMEEEE